MYEFTTPTRWSFNSSRIYDDVGWCVYLRLRCGCTDIFLRLTALHLPRPGWAGCLICADALLWLDSGLYKHRSICSLQPQRLCTHKLNCHALCIEKQQQPGPLWVYINVWPNWCLFALCEPAKRNLYNFIFLFWKCIISKIYVSFEFSFIFFFTFTFGDRRSLLSPINRP